jgi:hypothetical protein
MRLACGDRLALRANVFMQLCDVDEAGTSWDVFSRR